MTTDVFLNQKRVNVREHTVDTWHFLHCVFTYIYSLLNKKDICDCWNISVKPSCVYMCLSSDLLIFFSKSSLFLFLLSCYLYFSTFHSICSDNINLFVNVGDWCPFSIRRNLNSYWFTVAISVKRQIKLENLMLTTHHSFSDCGSEISHYLMGPDPQATILFLWFYNVLC